MTTRAWNDISRRILGGRLLVSRPMRDGSPLVTVITPAYNVGAWIGDAVSSVLAQTERRFEYIVVDDGSTDDTADIVRTAAAGDDRVRFRSSGNGGSAAARNLGLAEASAPFIAFLDGDDRWNATFLERQLAVLQAAPADVGAVFCHTRVMLENGHVVAWRWQPAGPCDFDLLLAENNPMHNGSSLLIRRSCFDETGVFDTSLPSATDFDMWMRIAAKSSTPVFWGSRRYLLDMRLMRTGSISANRGARFAGLDTILAEYAPLMARLHPGLAYVRPAVFAYRDGFDDFGDRWASEAQKAGTAALVKSVWGQAMVVWNRSSPSGRARLRSARDAIRARVYGGISRAQRFVG
ncbi:MAG: hypothetical protein JWR88_1158 [Pseudonocardia sp.]|nr:hypothetical protein [Pseudonocardia sp.]